MTITMKSYLTKLADRRSGEYVLCDFPTAKSKSKRLEYENMVVETDESKMVDKTEYMEYVGEVAWPGTMVFVECAYYCSRLGSFSNGPNKQHRDAVLMLMGYMIKNMDRGITYGGKLKIPFGLTQYPEYFVESRGFYAVSDSSWATRAKPQGGHALMRANGVVLWSSRGLKIVADSSAHAETAEASRATKSTVFMRMVQDNVKRPVLGPTLLLCDSSACVDMVVKEGSSSKSRHFERTTIFVKYMVMKLVVACKLISTRMMIADIFTKATDEQTFTLMRGVLRNEGEPETPSWLPYSVAMTVQGLAAVVSGRRFSWTRSDRHDV